LHDRYKKPLSATANTYFTSNINKFLADLSLEGKTYVNENNYFLKQKSGLQSELFVNVLHSPLNKAKNLSSFEAKSLATNKAIAKCRVTEKNETSLRMFYKEGNDNILNGVVPDTGLGCDKDTQKWTQALNNFFDSEFHIFSKIE